MATVYLNGEFLQDSEAKISIFDRGLLFGDSIYEVVPLHCNKLVGFEQHMQRLERSLKAIKMEMPLSAAQWHEIFCKLITANALPDEELCIYLQITRGTQSTRSHVIPKKIKPTVMAMCYPSPKKSEAAIQRGFHAITQRDKRRYECFIKSTSLVANVMAHQAALDCNADETIFVRDGLAIEGTSSNLFIVSNGTLITPPLQPQILPGVTRKTMLEMAQQNQIPAAERDIPVKELLAADEVWLTGSAKELYPIISINETQIGNGTPGPVWSKMYSLYQHYKRDGNHTNHTDNRAPL